MKKKDIITIVLSITVMGVALYFGLNMLGIGPKEVENPEAEAEIEEIYVPGDIDEETLQEVKKLNDYGEASLDNIGRVNPFGSL